MAIKKKGLGKGLDALLGDAFNAASQQQKVNSSPSNQPARGLAAELNQLSSRAQQPSTSETEKTVDKPVEPIAGQPVLKTDTLLEVPVEMCQRGKYQPRRDIDPTSLEELAASIQNQGVMQPIILRAIASESAAEASYEIIAGERR